MAELEYLYPRLGTASIEECEKRVASVRTLAGIRPFDPAVITFLDDLSRELFTLVRSSPALAPLAFFLRKSAMVQLASNARKRVPEGSFTVPQGVVFHIPPTNVDTLFVYTLALALVTGNTNIIRISENAGPATTALLEVLFNVLDRHDRIAALVTTVRFSRDAEVLERLSGLCSVRMIWGGDASVTAIRNAPLPPHAKDLTFPDRLSFAMIGTEAWTAATENERNATVEGLYNDSYWFDQMACSSPQQIVMVGHPEEGAAVTEDLFTRLDQVARARYEQADGLAINKMVAAVRGSAGGAGRLHWASNASVALEGLSLADAAVIRPGGGFFSIQHVRSPIDLLPQIDRRVQTLSVFGLSRESIVQFIELLNGRGIDRVVSIGHALDFSAVWDGKDLTLELLRLVTVE